MGRPPILRPQLRRDSLGGNGTDIELDSANDPRPFVAHAAWRPVAPCIELQTPSQGAGPTGCAAHPSKWERAQPCYGSRLGCHLVRREFTVVRGQTGRSLHLLGGPPHGGSTGCSLVLSLQSRPAGTISDTQGLMQEQSCRLTSACSCRARPSRELLRLSAWRVP